MAVTPTRPEVIGGDPLRPDSEGVAAGPDFGDVLRQLQGVEDELLESRFPTRPHDSDGTVPAPSAVALAVAVQAVAGQTDYTSTNIIGLAALNNAVRIAVASRYSAGGQGRMAPRRMQESSAEVDAARGRVVQVIA